MCVEIKASGFSDLSQALKLDREAFGPDAWTILDYLGVFSEESVRKFTALVDGRFAGFAAAEFDSEEEAVCLMTLAVRPEFRRRGLGMALLQRCETAFGAKPAYLYVDSDNQSAIRLYEKSGYRKTGIIPGYYMNGHDAIIMKKP